MVDEKIVKSRVDAGVRWLDETVPGWHNKIDLTVFQVNECGKCVIGQVFGSYNKLWSYFDHDMVWAHHHGFWCSPVEDMVDGEQFRMYMMDYYDILRQMWEDVIFNRQAYPLLQKDI